MGKIVDLKTAKNVGLNFLESKKRKDPKVMEDPFRQKQFVVKERELELIHQGASLTQFGVRDKKQTKKNFLELKLNEEPCFYMFNSNDGGYVIVSADENLPPILGYSPQGSIDESDLPPAMIDFMESVRKDILNTRKEKKNPSREIVEVWERFKKNETEPIGDGDVGGGSGGGDKSKRSVEPLIKTRWHQNEPFNRFCPTGCPTGCWATALAQVMFYYAFPNTGTGVRNNTNFGATTYRWDLMPQSLTTTSPEDEIEAVATLMRHCGFATDMDYTLTGSFTNINSAENALKTYFSYDSGIAIKNDNSDNAERTNIIKNEICNERPVLFRGTNNAGEGHAFICDGYDEDGFFSINWGWGGGSGEYFLLTNLGDFSSINHFIYNIKPNVIFKTIDVLLRPNVEDHDGMIIFPYGKVPIVNNHSRTFMIFKNYQYLVQKVMSGGQTLAIRTKGNRWQVTLENVQIFEDSSVMSFLSLSPFLVVDLRYKQAFNYQGLRYRPLSPSFEKVNVVRPGTGSSYSGNIRIPKSFKIVYDHDFSYNVGEIENRAFAGQTIDSVNIDFLTQIGEEAFYNCDIRKYINLRADKIEARAFINCNKILYVTLNVKEIGTRAFAGCLGITEIHSLSDFPPRCGEGVFEGLYKTVYGLPSLKHIKLYVFLDCKDRYEEAEVWKDFTIIGLRRFTVELFFAIDSYYYQAYEMVRKKMLDDLLKEEFPWENPLRRINEARELVKSMNDILTKEEIVQLKNIAKSKEAAKVIINPKAIREKEISGINAEIELFDLSNHLSEIQKLLLKVNDLFG